jgi:uncharacterized protein HemX
MLDVVDGLVEEFGDVVVVERVDDRAAAALADDQAVYHVEHLRLGISDAQD